MLGSAPRRPWERKQGWGLGLCRVGTGAEAALDKLCKKTQVSAFLLGAQSWQKTSGLFSLSGSFLHVCASPHLLVNLGFCAG